MLNEIYTVVGNRPQFIKIDPELPQKIIHSGQHYDYNMSQSFFKSLKLPKPYRNLGCKATEAGSMFDKLVRLFKKDKPGLVLVYGDTTSTLMGALAGAHCGIKVAHVEAGCRSGDMLQVEEVNRVVVDRISSIHFAFTRECLRNLINEGITDKHAMYVHGDPMYDALNRALPAKQRKDNNKFILVTIHRDFNADNKGRLKGIMEAFGKCKDEKFYFPVHPRTKQMLEKIKIPDNVKIMKPVGYKQMVELESNAKKIVTDSGGVQREAYWLRKPCIILRKETEWPHTVSDGWAVLVDGDPEVIEASIKLFLPKSGKRQSEEPKFGVHKKIRNRLSNYV